MRLKKLMIKVSKIPGDRERYLKTLRGVELVKRYFRRLEMNLTINMLMIRLSINLGEVKIMCHKLLKKRFNL